MRKNLKSFLLITSLIFVILLSACGQTSEKNTNNGNGGIDASEGQRQLAPDKINSVGSDVSNSGQSDNNEFMKMLNRPKLPDNYTYSYIMDQKVSTDNKVGSDVKAFQRIFRKDSRYKVETIKIESGNEEKVVIIDYYDSDKKLQQTYNVQDNRVQEISTQVYQGPIEIIDPKMQMKGGIMPLSEGIKDFPEKIGEENIEGYPCEVFEIKGEEGSGKWYISVEYNIILKLVAKVQNAEVTLTLKGFKAGQVTDDIVEPNIPKDAKR